MSTTFDVYPRTNQLPSFAAIVDRSTVELHRFLASVGIGARPPVHLRVQRCEDDSHVPFALNAPARWGKDTYAWFMVGEVAGGADAYFDDDQGAIQERWDGGFDDPRYKRLEPLIRECIATGHRWWFRRSAGQPAIINVAYGLMAASLAAITDGFITSDVLRGTGSGCQPYPTNSCRGIFVQRKPSGRTFVSGRNVAWGPSHKN